MIATDTKAPPKSRGVIFSAPMVRAILDGKKTQTRRLVKPQPPPKDATVAATGSTYGWMSCKDSGDSGLFRPVGPVWKVRELMGSDSDPRLRCPYGKIGDRLWVRETFYLDHLDAIDAIPKQKPDDADDWIYYRADGTCCDQIPECSCAEVGKPKWRSPIHMPRWASRITLRITKIRVQRVTDISEQDARAEGVNPVHEDGAWVWAISFQRVQKEDAS
ncbi:MAG TPA: hypothetical protein VK797_23520 [Tepidisphaeraceae bacterium]|jgi:hypothetical protein|nr:hypothetical protein [Tepidisphaeraceae bacterium]